MSFKASTNHQLPASSPADLEQANEQLRAKNQELRNELEMRKQENTLLNEMISTVGSTLRLDEVLRHLVDVVVRATSCHVAFIYLYDKDKERLVLASTNERYHHLEGKITMSVGEGIAGWVALHRKPVFLTDGALEDPRFCYFPELEEEKFQSIMTVPIISKIAISSELSPSRPLHLMNLPSSTASLLVTRLLLSPVRLRTRNSMKARSAN